MSYNLAEAPAWSFVTGSLWDLPATAPEREQSLFSALVDREVAVVTISGTEQWSHLCAPICASSCFISQVRQQYPCIRCSSEVPHGCGCKSSKRVQLSWQDAWKLSSDLATQEAFLSAVASLGFYSHDMTQNSLLSTGKSSLKRFRSCLMQKQYTTDESQVSFICCIWIKSHIHIRGFTMWSAPSTSEPWFW